MLSYREIDYKNFGKCLEVSNGVVDILVTFYYNIIKIIKEGKYND